MELESGNLVKDLQRWIHTYLQEIANKNLAARTITIYTGILDGFVEYARQYQGEVGLADVNRIFLNGYLSDLEKISKKFSASTKKLNITVLKAFFTYITENNEQNADYTKMFKKMVVKLDIKEKPGLSGDEVSRLLRYLEIEKKMPRNRLITQRNSLLIKTMLYGGLRAHELLELRLKDFELNVEHEVYVLLVRGKGGKERYVYVPYSLAADEIETLLEAHGRDWPICSTRTGGIINLVNLNQIVTGIYKRGGIEKKGLHILRHTMARRHVTAGTNLETIRDLLGHSNISITATFYAKTNEENKMAAVSMVGKSQV
jgi:integrase/recombinase XerD